jgi:hypothetical protein
MTYLTRWATLTRNPTEPKLSTLYPDSPPQHMVSATLDDDQKTALYLYFNAGDLSALESGDVVMVEYQKNKWRISKTQTPELISKLKFRAPSMPPSSPAIAHPTPSTPSNSSAIPANRWDNEHRATVHEELQRRARIIATCHKEIAAQFSDTNGNLLIDDGTIQRYARTLYLDLRSLWQ